MSAKNARKKGKTHAVIGSERAIEHLNPGSDTHARDKARAQEARERVAGLVIADDSPTETLKYPSLNNGVMLRADGTEITGEEHAALLSRLKTERGRYVMKQRRADGREYNRSRKTDGLRQLAITFRPEHALALARIDRAGLPVRASVIDYACKLGAEFARMTGYEWVAAQIHPEEGSLHVHLAYATVNKKRELLHPSEGIGRKGLRLAGPSVIGTLRLVDSGIWPEEDGRLARSWLADRRVGGADPVDYTLSSYLDGMADKTLLGLGKLNPVAAEIVNRARLDYETDAKQRRSERPDVVAKEVAKLQTRNAELEAANESLVTRNADLTASNTALKSEVDRLRADRVAVQPQPSSLPSRVAPNQDAPRRNRSGPGGLRP